MKNYTLGMLLSFISLISFGQMPDTIFYDKAWKETSNSDWEYYRIYSIDSLSKGVMATDYYKNGIIQMKGCYESLKGKKKIGEFVWFYENGKKKHNCNFHKNKKSGYSTSWFDDGYIDCEGSFVKGKKQGKWTYFFTDSIKSGEIEYSKGKIINERYWNQDGGILIDNADANKMPEFPGGMDNFRLIVAKNLVYPTNLESQGIQATVYVNFVVDSEGNMKDIEVLKTKYPDFDKEALRVIELANAKWTPGKKFNRYSDFDFTFPIVFVLTSNKVKAEKGYGL